METFELVVSIMGILLAASIAFGAYRLFMSAVDTKNCHMQ